MADDLNPPTATQKAEQHNQAAYIKAQQIAQQNAEIQHQREIAPGSLQSGSAQEAQVRQEAAKAEQQRMVQENVRQVGSSSDQFAKAREEALKTGKFDYSSVGYASKGTPASYVKPTGERVTRPQGGITGRGSTPGSVGVTPEPSKGGKEALGFSDIVSVSVTRGATQPKQTLILSQAQLERSNIARANLGLPPLQQIANVQVVKGIQTQQDLRAKLADLQGKAATKAKEEPEAVPFLGLGSPVKVSTGPKVTTERRGRTYTETATKLTGRESEGTKEIPYTNITDVLQFAPIGGIGLGAARSAARSSGSLAGKIVTSTGEVIVPKGVKPPEEKTIFDTVRETFSKGKTNEKPLEPKPSMERVSLGTGIGREVSTGGKGGKLSTGTKPGGRPPSETPKTTSAGRGLEQIVKEKEEPFGKKTETKTTTKAQQATQDYVNKLKGKSKLEEPGTIMRLPPGVKGPSTIQTEKEETGPFVPAIPILVPPITIQTPKEKQEEKLGVFDLLTTRQGTTTQPKEERTSATDVLQTQKTSGKQTTDQTRITEELSIYKTGGGETSTGGGILGGGLGGGMPGFLEKVSKSGATREYLGNVPLEDIVGVYKREEVTYGRASKASAREKETNYSSVFSTKKGSSKRLI